MSGNRPWYEVTEDDPRERSAHDADLRAAYEAMQRISPDTFTFSGGGRKHFVEIVDDVERKFEESLEAVDAELGPRVSWVAGPPPDDYDWPLEIMHADFDDGENDEPAGAWSSLTSQWGETAFARAARFYRRDCGWDFTPGEAGIWIIAVAPTRSWGSADAMSWGGNLVGFVILHDRDDDFEYESIAHLWTASGWRRRGIAAALIEHARGRFPLRNVEGPLTDASAALLAAVAPDLVSANVE